MPKTKTFYNDPKKFALSVLMVFISMMVINTIAKRVPVAGPYVNQLKSGF